MRSRQHLIALVVAAAFTLTGCGTSPMGTLATSQVAGVKAPQASGAIVTVTRGAAAPVAGKASAVKSDAHLPQLIINGQYELSDEALADDAESEGYSIFAADNGNGADKDKAKVEQKFSKTGIVRRTETGFSFEASNGLFKSKKKPTYFTLTGSAEFMTMIADRENKKAQIKGTVDKDNVVTVTSVKGLADMGFLTNWFTKGKLTGKVVDKGTGLPLPGASVTAKSADGFVLKGFSETDGTFAIKNVTPGTYFLTVVHAGHVTLKDESVEVAKRKSTDTTVKLPAEVVEAPAATAAE